MTSLAPLPRTQWRSPPVATSPWRKQVLKAQSWLLKAQSCGAFVVEDVHRVRWQVVQARSTRALYYVHGDERVAEMNGLVLWGASRCPSVEDSGGDVGTPRTICSGGGEHAPAKVSTSATLAVGTEFARGSFATILYTSVDGCTGFAVKRSKACLESRESIQRDEHYLRQLSPHEGIAALVGGFWDSTRRRCLILPLAASDLHSTPPREERSFRCIARQLITVLGFVHSRKK